MGEDGSGTVAGLAALMARAERADASPAPVERWHPAHCGDIDIVIRADGSWVHEGAVIGRPELVRLFSTVLRKDEDGETYLVTPAERLRITVEDAPFLAVEMAVEEVGYSDWHGLPRPRASICHWHSAGRVAAWPQACRCQR